MTNRILSVFFLIAVQTATADEIIDVTPAVPVSNGSMMVFRKTGALPSEVLIHFHGAPQSVKAAFAKSSLDAVVVVVNFPGLSTAYSKPFAEDPELFEQIQARARAATVEAARDPGLAWQRVTVSSFSAGYGAVREILKTPRYFERIDCIVTADSIYAGLQPNDAERNVDENNMRDFLRFASLATEDKKNFVLSHSAQLTPYASTTETANYLLKSLQIKRDSDTSLSTDAMRQASRAECGKLLILGFDGTTGKEHLQHLHNLDVLWNLLSTKQLCPSGRRATAGFSGSERGCRRS